MQVRVLPEVPNIMITATIKIVQQVGPSDWHTSRYSKNFENFDSIQDILNWGESLNLGFKVTINTFTFSEYINGKK